MKKDCLYYDLATITTMDDVENQIINIGSKNLVVFIDGLYNLQTDNKKDGIRVENIERAQGGESFGGCLSSSYNLYRRIKEEAGSWWTNQSSNNPRHYGDR